MHTTTHEAAAVAATGATKERPIPFSGAMVRALLAGTKTQTRRACKPRKHPDMGCWMAAHELVREAQHVIARACPYGQPGDRLWVREAFRGDSSHDCIPPSELPPAWALRYEADGDIRPGLGCADGKLRPPMFMPRAASRLLLEITGVRVERLQDIDYDDCIAEGMKQQRTCINPGQGIYADANDVHDDYRALWEQINGAGSWDTNPWVWVVEFKRLAA